MPNRIPRGAAGLAAALGLLAVTACGSGPANTAAAGGGASPGHSTAANPSVTPDPSPDPSTRPAPRPSLVPPGGALPNIAAVELGTSFDPDALHLGAGQQFMVIVSKTVKASGSGIDGACTAAAAARFSSTMLSLRCSGPSYLFTTRQAGTTVLSVTIRPNCAPGTMCPDWISEAHLSVTVTG